MEQLIKDLDQRIAELQIQQAQNALAVIEALNVIMLYNMRAERIDEINRTLNLITTADRQ